MIELLRRKLSGFLDIPEASADDFRALCRAPQTLPARAAVAVDGGRFDQIYLIERGWALRERHLPDGGRQIVNAAMPGDVLCLNALIFETSQFDIVAKTEMLVHPLPPAELRGVLGRNPDLAAALFWVSAQEEAVLAERVVSLGRRSARVRSAHVLAELLARMALVEEVSDLQLSLPLTQEDFSDILGISVVHANKTLRALEREGVITLRNGMLTVHDRQRLEAIAGFDPGYLHFARMQRRAPSLASE